MFKKANESKKTTNTSCPFLNKNEFCVVTKAGAGCRLESYCASENHAKCGDYNMANNWKCDR
ncbi:MAG: hypothetical protein ACOY46_02810 [Bacillota bacterium]